MKFTGVLFSIVIAMLLCMAVSAADGVVMYDFETDNKGWVSTFASDVNFDGNNYVFTAAQANPTLSIRHGAGEFLLGDYKYLVVKAKSDAVSDVKPYVMLADKDGNNLYTSIWDVPGKNIPSQKMKTDYNVHVFDLTALGTYPEPYLKEIQFGIGLYAQGNTCHVDYIALYTEEALYRTVSFDKNTTDEVTGMPQASQVLDRAGFTPDGAVAPNRAGYYFIGWAKSADGQVISDIDCVDADTTLYAVWMKQDGTVVRYDFRTNSLGWGLSNGEASFDGNNYVFTSTDTNPVLSMKYGTGEFPLGDFKYLVVRGKNTGIGQAKPYVMLTDKNGTKLYDSIWSGSGAGIPGQTMKKDFNIHVFDLTALGVYDEPYVSEIMFGLGLYDVGKISYIDYIAFYTEDALYKTVSFDKNTADAVERMPLNEKIINGENYTPDPAFVPRREGYYFVGWAMSAEGEVISDIENVVENKTLYAVWAEDTRLSVTYEANAFGQKVVYMPMNRVQKVERGIVKLPETKPGRADFAFSGWSKTADGKSIVQDGFTITEDTTLYAVWSAGSCEWDLSNGRPAGYGMASGAAEKQIEGGIEYTVTSNDPMIYINNINIPTNVYKKLHIIAKVTLPEGKTNAALKVYTLVDGLAMHEDRAKSVACTTTTDYVDYVIDFGEQSFWTSAKACTQLRFDITDNCPNTVIAVQKLYFEVPSNTIYFNANGGRGEMSTVEAQAGYRLPECTFTRDGFAFAGYTDGVTTYNAGDSITVTSPTLLYATWDSLGGLDSKLEVFYPDYAKKAIVLSYDDGPTADATLVKKLNAGGMKAAFNLNSGRGFYTEAKREYYRELYAGHEIGNHTKNHYDMRLNPPNGAAVLTPEQCYEQIRDGKLFLEEYFGVPVTGLAWPNTNPNRPETNKYVSERYLYARNAPVTGKLEEFAVPESFSPSWDFTCIDQNGGVDYSTGHLDRYFSLDTNELTQLSIWGHPSDVESHDRWDLVDYMIKLYTASGQNIWNPTVSDYVKYINATRSLVKTADFICNPSDVDVYAQIDGVPVTLKAKSIYDGSTFTNLNTFAALSASKAKVTFAVDLTQRNQNALVVVACYTEGGRLCGVKVLDAESGKVTMLDCEVDTYATAAKAKVYTLSDDDTYSVMGESQEIK